MNSVETFTASVYVGRKHRDTCEVFPLEWGKAFLQGYVEGGLCVTLTETEYIYTNGGEPGFAVGLINYPRFPSTPDAIRKHALAIAAGLLRLYRQFKVSVVFPCETVMVEGDGR